MIDKHNPGHQYGADYFAHNPESMAGIKLRHMAPAHRNTRAMRNKFCFVCCRNIPSRAWENHQRECK